MTVIHYSDRQDGERSICALFADGRPPNPQRVKGGITGEYVIRVPTMREFQCSHSSTAEQFKPVSEGFEFDSGGKVLPAGAKE